MNFLSSNTACPTEPELRDFFRAGLAPEQMDDVQTHIEGCDKCILFLDQQENSDTVVRALTSVSATVDDEIEFQRLQSYLLSDPQPIDTETWVREISTTTARRRLDPTKLLGQVVDNYELLELLGCGANGAVFRAKHNRLEREFALKLLSPTERRKESIEDFRREMKAIGSLDHRNIIHATDAGEANGRYYLVMDLLEGVDLSQLIRKTGPLSIANAAKAIQLAAEGLHFAHEQGMIHRDVKPSNLFFEFAGNIRLLDLGLVSWSDLSVDEASSVARGTADYMSPEQWQDFHHVDRRADIYSLGCTFYKLLIGKSPYADAIGTEAKMLAHLHSDFPSARLGRQDMPLGLDRFLRRMTSKNPRDRYATMREVADALENYASDADLSSLKYEFAGEPIPLVDTAASTTTRSDRQRITRKRFLFTALAASSLVLIGTSIRRNSRPKTSPTWHALGGKNLMTVSLDETAQVTRGNKTTVRIASSDSTVVRMGRPIHGRFQLETTIQELATQSSAGLTVGYRKSKPEIGIQHLFQTFEASIQNDELQLIWRNCDWLIKKTDSELKEELWAKTALPHNKGQFPLTISLTLGDSPFPIVHINGAPIDKKKWTISRAAKAASQRRTEQLHRRFLGEVGLFADGPDVVFTGTRLKYIETAK